MKKLFSKWLNIYKQKKRSKTAPLKDISLEDHIKVLKRHATSDNMGWIAYNKRYGTQPLDVEKCKEELQQSYLAIAYGLTVCFISNGDTSYISLYKGTECLCNVLFFTNDYPAIKKRCDGRIGYSVGLASAWQAKALAKAREINTQLK